MKFCLFHLMPYAPLDLSFDQKYPSSWMALPNSYYDPKQGHILYNRYLDELELGDQLGFEVLCVNEHHQTAYGLMATPGVLAGALSRRTKRARIAVLGRALPLLNNPLSVAEEYAILDNITGGRLVAGFVRGIGVEYHSTGSNPAKSHERFHEAHDLILQAWTRTGPFPFEGKHYQFQYVNLWPRPYQQPHPPIWIPSQGSTETIEWASHPDRKYTYLQTFSPVTAVKRFHTQYKETAARYGYEASPDKLGWALPIYVSETDESARREAKPHIEAMYNKFLRMPLEFLLPPGYTSVSSMKKLRQAKASFTSDAPPDCDEFIRRGMFICGSPETVRQTLTHHQNDIGFNVLVAMMQIGSMPSELTRKSMTLLAEKVMPHMRDAAGAPSPAFATVP
jgi:alkanesulfonate monooxygenase SsuD/methylene tetrahydromethanopterin reductase-like flavin-dependent oxidoreductase (luciferase family)